MSTNKTARDNFSALHADLFAAESDRSIHRGMTSQGRQSMMRKVHSMAEKSGKSVFLHGFGEGKKLTASFKKPEGSHHEYKPSGEVISPHPHAGSHILRAAGPMNFAANNPWAIAHAAAPGASKKKFEKVVKGVKKSLHERGEFAAPVVGEKPAQTLKERLLAAHDSNMRVHKNTGDQKYLEAAKKQRKELIAMGHHFASDGGYMMKTIHAPGHALHGFKIVGDAGTVWNTQGHSDGETKLKRIGKSELAKLIKGGSAKVGNFSAEPTANTATSQKTIGKRLTKATNTKAAVEQAVPVMVGAGKVRDDEFAALHKDAKNDAALKENFKGDTIASIGGGSKQTKAQGARVVPQDQHGGKGAHFFNANIFTDKRLEPHIARKEALRKAAAADVKERISAQRLAKAKGAKKPTDQFTKAHADFANDTGGIAGMMAGLGGKIGKPGDPIATLTPAAPESTALPSAPPPTQTKPDEETQTKPKAPIPTPSSVSTMDEIHNPTGFRLGDGV